jgi:hypothetical protein
MSVTGTLFLLTWLGIAALGITLAGVVRQVHYLAKQQTDVRRVGPQIGSVAPALSEDLHLQSWSRPTLLLFADADCPSCEAALSELPTIQNRFSGLDVVALFPGTSRFVGGSVRVIEDAPDAFARFQVKATPFAVFVDGGGRVVHAGLVGSAELRDALTQTIGLALQKEMTAR